MSRSDTYLTLKNAGFQHFVFSTSFSGGAQILNLWCRKEDAKNIYGILEADGWEYVKSLKNTEEKEKTQWRRE